MIDVIKAQPHQIGDALWRFDAAQVPAIDMPHGISVGGMGGSAIGTDLASDILGDRIVRPIRLMRGYGLVPWADAQTMYLFASYSGSTEETLTAFETAGKLGAPRVVLTTGGPLAELARAAAVPVIGVPSGMQPRAAVIYMTVAVLELAAATGAAPSVRAEVEAAGPGIERVLASDTADRVAEELAGKIVIVHGSGPTADVARRWKSQLNENSKMPAFVSELPESNHNEIESWRTAIGQAEFAAVMLESPEQHPRVQHRFDVLSGVLGELGVPVTRLRAEGASRAEQVLTQVTLGDLVSLRLAERAGIDPEAIPTIEGFKARL